MNFDVVIANLINTTEERKINFLGKDQSLALITLNI